MLAISLATLARQQEQTFAAYKSKAAELNMEVLEERIFNIPIEQLEKLEQHVICFKLSKKS